MPYSKIQKTLSETLKRKVVVTDTSALLASGIKLLDSLGDCQLVVPIVVVKELEEKRAHPTLGFLAREWLRLIETCREDGQNLSAGINIPGHSSVVLQVEPNHTSQKTLPKHLQDGSHDSTILAVANNLKGDNLPVVLLSNDMPMRLHSSLELGIDAFEYKSESKDKTPFLGRAEMDVESAEVNDLDLYGPSVSRALARAVENNLPEGAAHSSFTELSIGGIPTKEAVLTVGEAHIKVGHKTKASGITGKTLEQIVFMEMLKLSPEELPVVSVGGGAGTGKTLLTIASALEELRKRNYEKIVIFRSLHELGQGQEMGFLPGGVDEKMAPWAGAIQDAIDSIVRIAKPLRKNASVVEVEKQKAEAVKLRAMIEIAPITYLRGRSFHNTFMILEEAQNFSRHEILNILSRTGLGTKVVLNWDANQVDSRFLKSGKSADVWAVVNDLKHLDIFGHITLTKTERSRVAALTAGILEDSPNR